MSKVLTAYFSASGETAKAAEKLAKEMEADNDRIFAEAVIGNLIEQCEEDLRLAQDVMQKHKT